MGTIRVNLITWLGRRENKNNYKMGAEKSIWTKQLLLSTVVACLGSIQYGYHMAELNAPEAVLSCRKSIHGPTEDYLNTWFGKHGYKECIDLNTQEIGFVTSIFSIGGLVGSSVASSLSDKFGRKNSSFINISFFLVGSLIETLSNTKTSLALGRLLSGLGAGTSIVNTPLLINEIASNDAKGFLGSLNQFSVNIGILSTQLFALRWANNEQWRYLLLTGFFIAAINVLGLFFIDESPKWLVKNGKSELAKKNLRKLRNLSLTTEDDIDEEINQWVLEIRGKMSHTATNSLETAGLLNSEEASVGIEEDHLSSGTSQETIWGYLSKPEYFNSRLVVTIIMIGQQFCGINSIIFYGVSVVSTLLPKYAVLLNCLISVLNVVVTFLSATIVDRLGRRPLLILSIGLMGILSFLVSVGILNSFSVLTVFAIITYICAFAIGLGPIPFLLVSEVTQINATTIAQSVGTVLNWLATFLVGFLFPVLNASIGGYVFGLFAAICALTLYLVWKIFPETKGKKNYFEVWQVNDRLD